MDLLTSSIKTEKSVDYGFLTGILYLAPHTASGHNTCPWASKGCAAACLNTSGRGRMQTVQNARIRKTNSLFANRQLFLLRLHAEISVMKAESSQPVAIRLNGTSDLPWETYPLDGYGKTLMELHPDVQFYDYTKSLKRALNSKEQWWPSNYHLTFSLSESNEGQARIALGCGITTAVVFRKAPETFWGYEVACGDRHDLRFLDPAGCVVALSAKGRAKHDTTGFVR